LDKNMLSRKKKQSRLWLYVFLTTIIGALGILFYQLVFFDSSQKSVWKIEKRSKDATQSGLVAAGYKKFESRELGVRFLLEKTVPTPKLTRNPFGYDLQVSSNLTIFSGRLEKDGQIMTFGDVDSTFRQSPTDNTKNIIVGKKEGWATISSDLLGVVRTEIILPAGSSNDILRITYQAKENDDYSQFDRFLKSLEFI
jgi:hypothetical protein